MVKAPALGAGGSVRMGSIPIVSSKFLPKFPGENNSRTKIVYKKIIHNMNIQNKLAAASKAAVLCATGFFHLLRSSSAARFFKYFFFANVCRY